MPVGKGTFSGAAQFRGKSRQIMRKDSRELQDRDVWLDPGQPGY